MEGEGLRGRRGAVPDRILGAAGVVMILAALYLLLFGGPADSGAAAGAPPDIVLIEPTIGSPVDQPVMVRFVVDRQVAPQPGGWGVDGFHLHATLDGQELMPGAGDIRRAEGSIYTWALPRLEPGVHTVGLFWSDADHVRVEGSGTEVRRVEVR